VAMPGSKKAQTHLESGQTTYPSLGTIHHHERDVAANL
jgi:hypothetical protein